VIYRRERGGEYLLDFEFVTAISMKSNITWHMTSCGLVK
jgi:hypothetical protein